VDRAGRERAGFLFLMAGKGDVLLLKRHGTGSKRSGPHLSAVYCLRASLPDLSMPGTCWAAFLQSALFLAELESVSSSDSQWAAGVYSGAAGLPGGVGCKCSGYTEKAAVRRRMPLARLKVMPSCRACDQPLLEPRTGEVLHEGLLFGIAASL
jgi:hypothetical protein